MVAVGEADPASIVATLRHALESLTQLSAERASLEEALKVRASAAERRTPLPLQERGDGFYGALRVPLSRCPDIALLCLPHCSSNHRIAPLLSCPGCMCPVPWMHSCMTRHEPWPVLQAEKGRDNILPRIMASSNDYDALFQVRPSY